MTTEAAEQVLEVSDEAQEEAAFNAVFADGGNEQPDPEPEQTAEATSPEVTDTATEEQPPAQDESPVLLAGLTEDQVKDLLLKAGKYDELGSQVQKIFGRLGAFNDTLNTLKQRSSSGVQLTPEKFKRLGQQFPELAEMLSADLSEAIGTGAGSAFDPKQVDDLVTSRLTAKEQEIQRQMESRWLKKQHRDWEGVVSSTDFNLWKDNVLPQEDRQQLENSWDADYIADKLTAFKEWKAAQAKPQNQTQENRQKRLESAVLPRGKTSTTTPIDEEEAYLSAWKT